MKLLLIAGAVATLIALTGCVKSSIDQSKAAEPPLPEIIVQTKSTDTILSCVADKQAMTRREFRTAFNQTSKLGERDPDYDALNIVCLSLHDYASYKQFKMGIEVLSAYIKGHPDDAKGLGGLLRIMQRMDKEIMSKWTQYNKATDEKESLDAENKELFERNAVLEKNAEENQSRIKELQQQIEQLKNIENIIKNRER